MDKHLEKFLIAGLVMILVLISLSGCGTKPIKTENKQPTQLETIGKIDSIGIVLGCMFAPVKCKDMVSEQDEKESNDLDEDSKAK